MRRILIALFSLITLSVFSQQTPGVFVRLNQIGFYPDGQKLAVVLSDTATDFYITAADSNTKLYSGKLIDLRNNIYSKQLTRIADFTSFAMEGIFILHASGAGSSYPFEIKKQVHYEVTKAAIKSFYYQRFSIPLTEKYAGKWARPASSSHKKVIVHASAATASRPAGSVISSTRGWIDAGDYNKYIVNSGITTSTLLSAYEDFPNYFSSLNLNIPESSNKLPDILDEVLWNLRWMMTMQDLKDGGVYHKCTNAKFDGMIMPNKGTTPRYVVMKSTAAALNFAAVTAQASRVFRNFSKQLPGLADSCLNMSRKAYQWAVKNPRVIYDQDKMNKLFNPDITTGAYGDGDVSDEFAWAAAELYTVTADNNLLKNITTEREDDNPIPSWNQTRLLAYYTLVRHAKPNAENELLIQTLKGRIVGAAESLVRNISYQAYHTVMGTTPKDFEWGSNAVAANQGILLLQAFHLTNDKKYLDNALSNLDYLLGRNATGYSFLTGHGDKTPMHIHHRPSEADGIIEPVPGLLAGGPNPGMEDKCTTYPSSVPDEAYTDDVCSYASNEVAINWNAPFVYLSAAIEFFYR